MVRAIVILGHQFADSVYSKAASGIQRFWVCLAFINRDI